MGLHWGIKNTVLVNYKVPYSRKLSREKTILNFAVLWLFAKVFSGKFGGIASFGVAKASNLQKFSLQNLGVWRPLVC